MRTVVLGERAVELQSLIARRHDLGQDLYDEVWEGTYYVTPGPGPAHGIVQLQLAVLLAPLAAAAGLVGGGPFNLGEPGDYRVPDQGYHRDVPRETFVPTAAVVIEVAAPDDQTYEKFGFYAAHGVDEVIVADPDARTVRCWRRRSEPAGYDETATSSVLDVDAAALGAEIRWP